RSFFMSNRFVASLFRFVIVVCFFSIIASAHASDSKQVAEIKTASYECGEVFEGKDVIHDFIIKNTGDANLEIKGVKAG
ncbi:MAG: hypothetical protein M0Z56_13450, partial [Desulfobacteraceae bacterium]|nr:hypothetical protein [Desulfobacteraceae bacterium]